MSDVKVTYKFSRDSHLGFLRHNRASTDAIGLLHQWKAVVPTREYEIHRDDGEDGNAEDVVIATLKTSQLDAHNHRGQIDTLCESFGLSREVISHPS
jgi:hypothetical protein